MDETKIRAYIEELNSMKQEIENNEDEEVIDADTYINIGINIGLMGAIGAFKRHFMNN